MRTDVLTIAAIIFVFGLLMSAVSVSDIFSPASEQEVPVALQ